MANERPPRIILVTPAAVNASAKLFNFPRQPHQNPPSCLPSVISGFFFFFFFLSFLLSFLYFHSTFLTTRLSPRFLSVSLLVSSTTIRVLRFLLSSFSFSRLIYGGLLPDFPEIPLLPLLFLEIGSHLVASYFRIFVSFLFGKWAFFEFPQTNVFVTAKLELNRSSTIIKNSLKRMIYSSL